MWNHSTKKLNKIKSDSWKAETRATVAHRNLFWLLTPQQGAQQSLGLVVLWAWGARHPRVAICKPTPSGLHGPAIGQKPESGPCPPVQRNHLHNTRRPELPWLRWAATNSPGWAEPPSTAMQQSCWRLPAGLMTLTESAFTGGMQRALVKHFYKSYLVKGKKGEDAAHSVWYAWSEDLYGFVQGNWRRKTVQSWLQQIPHVVPGT